MKKFRINSSILITLLVCLLSYNIFCLITLYDKVSSQTRELIVQSLRDADLDEILNRHKLYPAPDSVVTYKGKALSQSRSIDGDTLVVSVTDEKGELIEIRKEPLDPGTNYSDIMVSEIGYGAHQTIDPVFKLRIADMDSLFRLSMSRKGIKPDVAVVLNVNSKGAVLAGNVDVRRDQSLDSVSVCYNMLTGDKYVAYYSSPNGYVFRQMQGIVLSTAAIIVLIAVSFVYLLRTVSKMRTIEEMKDDFVSNMTHELKTPISIAYSANDALLNYDTSNDPEKKTAYLTIAINQLRHLGELVENILAVSMERRKSLTLKPERIDLTGLVNEIAEAQRMRGDKDISIDVQSEANVTVSADKSHLSNVLNNLIDNAIKYSGESVLISIRIGADGIEVADNGIGIPAKSLPYIFDKFYRVPHGNRQAVRGYGIGLYYVKHILGKMGWSISVRSQEGHGSVFTIEFDKNES